ncbi:MAG: MurR/RpiR family transcriptional regulator [Solobacterium sp.]|nr:MurR/RpiR family transcriptional regulator [Solobacterium sp.]
MDYRKTNDELTKYMNFIRYCNSHIDNDTDFSIVHTILENIDDLSSLSVDLIAAKAAVSNASVSRLIKKMGFTSAKDLRNVLNKARERVGLLREFYYQERTLGIDPAAMASENALKNIQSTVSSVNYEKLGRIISVLKASDRILFIGDIHELTVFVTFQLDFINTGVPAFSFMDLSYTEMESRFLTERSSAVFFSLAKEWHQDIYSEIFANAEKKKAHTIVFHQDEDPLFSGAEISYQYGISGSGNAGYYSLSILNDILCAMFWQD